MAETPDAGQGAGKGKRDSRLRCDAAATTAGQVVICRLWSEEIGVFDALCTQMGAASRSDWLRSIIRMSGGFLEFSRADSDALEGLHRELHRIGVNVNRVAHAANRGRVDLVRVHWKALTELLPGAAGVCMLLLQIIHDRLRCADAARITPSRRLSRASRSAWRDRQRSAL
ncbi:hypothetical protein [Rhodovulum sp.]|uniref:hypothetical protein n=1 Tax=Rhodovulum sp. TaxID=34009 RepID=UPI001840D638|nr:hypothetical protein [Rhodovulum sp.]HDR29989.1 hypothetical protein [Rhodovulum sp.]